jgi:hypothetical protein
MIRSDLEEYVVLHNEGECFVDGRLGARVSKLYDDATKLVNASYVTVGQDSKSKRLYLGYHETMSELTLDQMVRGCTEILQWKGKLELDVEPCRPGYEVHVIFLYPARHLKEFKKMIALAQKTMSVAWRA